MWFCTTIPHRWCGFHAPAGASSLLNGAWVFGQACPVGAISLLKAGTPLQPTCPRGAAHSAPSGALALIQSAFLTKISHLRCGCVFSGVSPAKMAHPRRASGLWFVIFVQRCCSIRSRDFLPLAEVCRGILIICENQKQPHLD